MINIKKILKIRNPATGEFEPLLGIKGEKGDKGDMPALSNELGDSETTAASQKLVTDKVEKLQEQVTSNTDNIADLIQQVGSHANSITGMLKVAHGTYVGENKTVKSLTFDFTPVFIYVSISDTLILTDSQSHRHFHWIANTTSKAVIRYANGSSVGNSIGMDKSTYVNIALSGNTLQWNGSGTSDAEQWRNTFCAKNVTYTYFALGI